MAVISMNSTGKDAPRDETSNSPLQVVEPSNFSLPAGDSEKIQLVLETFRCVVADLSEQFEGGHPGGAMGMAPIGVALWQYSEFLQPRSLCSINGHTGQPEIENGVVEVTTGPLGQGLANAVGLAMATKSLVATYNRPTHSIVDNMTWCMVGDECLQEGVTFEAICMAGHWKLNNLCVMYDNNQITCNGTVNLCNTEDINMTMRACGWDVIGIVDGSEDVSGIVQALWKAREATEIPTFINIKTIIGIGSESAGDTKTHGAAFGPDDIANMKRRFGKDPEKRFDISDEVYSFFSQARSRGLRVEDEWSETMRKYALNYPELFDELKLRMEGKMNPDWRSLIPKKDDFPTTPTASRKSAGLVCNPLAAKNQNMMVGTADLSPSVNMIWKGKTDFQHPDLRTTCGINGNYTGRYIHWGIREHAMASVSNGLAAFNKGTILPVTSTFFMFYLYAAPGIRMAALQGLQQIHIATHDSIGTGEDGPTHQPIALASFYLAMPNLIYIRPCDSEETAGAFIGALEATSTPTIISLSRQNLEQYPQFSSREGTQRGAYVFQEEPGAQVTLIGVGSEMVFAVKTKQLLAKRFNIKSRIVSFPSQRLFESQPVEYKHEVLQYKTGIPRVVIEAYAVNGWERYADAGFSMSTFGRSLPGADAYRYFGFDEEIIATQVAKLVEDITREGINILHGEFRDLNPV